MIKLERLKPPAELSSEAAKLMTSTFQATGKPVWQVDYIKKALAAQSHNKCTFCECELGIESKYLEVEHFACKQKYPDEVVAWNNLLAACRRCNGKKGAHDVRVEPIVNPFDDDPRHHIRMQAYRMRAITPTGDLTISLLNLNDVSRAVTARFYIGNQVCDSLDDLKEKIESYEGSPTSLRRAKIVNSLEALLGECLEEAPYAATAATVLHTESNYPKLREQLIELDVWTSELQQLHDSSFAIVLHEVAS
ncbi:HNH endonuclease [Achromobacter insolitus]|uniref:HNH endonuclease n=1 Tax=Achromobacter insolitus TaxID=217204 RepID=UPI00104214C1|nr:HNH endonuclease [Achromobacter insolitus]